MKGHNYTKILAFLLLGLAVVMVALGLRELRPPQTLVLKPVDNIQAYRMVDLSDFEQVPVPQTETSVTENDLTAEWLAEQIEAGEPVFFTQNLLPGQRLDRRLVGSDPQGSLSIVSPDERLVIVSGTAAGTLGGLLQPGSVVTVTSDGVDSEFAKVIAFGIGGDVGSGTIVRGDDSSADTADTGTRSAGGRGGQVLVLLSVAQGDASMLAGREATLTLNPHCRITDLGQIVPVEDGLNNECNAAGRLASTPDGGNEEGDEDEDDGTDEDEEGTENEDL